MHGPARARSRGGLRRSVDRRRARAWLTERERPRRSCGRALAPATASATVHMAEIGTTLVSGIFASTLRQRRLANRQEDRHPGRDRRVRRGGRRSARSLPTWRSRGWRRSCFTLGVYILLRFTLGGPPRPHGAGRTHVAATWLRSGSVAGFIDATGGGGWGPGACTPTLLATGKMGTAQGDRLGRRGRLPRRRLGEHRLLARAREPGHGLVSSWPLCSLVELSRHPLPPGSLR